MKKKLNRISGCGVTLPEMFERLIVQKKEDGKSRTSDNYRSAVNKLQVYLSETSPELTFHEITGEWVANYIRWLEKRHAGKPQTVDFYFRNLRTLYNAACTKYQTGISEGSNPFRKIVFREKSSAKRALAKEEIDKLLSPALREKIPEFLWESHDILLFTLFMRGMVFQDIYNLTWEMADADNHIHYRRSKTGILIDTEISSEARIIMERYRSEDSPYVFPFLHRNKVKGKRKELSEQSALRRVNRHAHRIGELAVLPISLSTYVMRHTFATLMLETSKPVELISQCLGHASIRTTQIYLSRISVVRVDKEVNDMFNQMLRPPENDSKKKSRKRPKGKENPENFIPALEYTSIDTLPNINKVEETEGKKSSEKKIPFLARKRQELCKPYI
ncbi:site-specific integrase [Parabacteroides faecis]|uniref:tyrosine-type recombinase/integrase n=1 Tax=Parabacteroides faecis TaxID=1217282 RepID=UPI002164739F|nr:site-specific integrase [Parabacteroides faecis]UVQ47853.1 site-specific integrase [Parabacteroides faecis]